MSNNLPKEVLFEEMNMALWRTNKHCHWSSL